MRIPKLRPIPQSPESAYSPERYQGTYSTHSPAAPVQSGYGHEMDSVSLEQHDESLVLDASSTVAPDYFTEMWDAYETTAYFTTALYPEPDMAQFKLVQLVQHLQNVGFYVVAAGEVDTTVTIYAYSSGYVKIRNEVDVMTVCCLLELKVLLDLHLEGEIGYWTLQCACKCTRAESTYAFISMMHLGDVLQLAN
jgi:hypothetical protein